MAQKKRLWDPWKMFDATPEELRAIKERSKMREALRAEWTKMYTNPFKSSHDGGFLFDPAIQRFIALKNTQAEYFRGTFRTTAAAFFVLVLPVAFISYCTITNMNEKDRMCRNGEIMYKDRKDKFFY